MGIGTRPQFLLTASCGQRWEVLRRGGLTGDAASHDDGGLRREGAEDAGQRLRLCEGGKLADRQRHLRDAETRLRLFQLCRTDVRP